MSQPASGVDKAVAEKSARLGRETAELIDKLVDSGIDDIVKVGLFMSFALDEYIKERQNELIDALIAGASDEDHD